MGKFISKYSYILLIALGVASFLVLGFSKLFSFDPGYEIINAYGFALLWANFYVDGFVLLIFGLIFFSCLTPLFLFKRYFKLFVVGITLLGMVTILLFFFPSLFSWEKSRFIIEDAKFIRANLSFTPTYWIVGIICLINFLTSIVIAVYQFKHVDPALMSKLDRGLIIGLSAAYLALVIPFILLAFIATSFIPYSRIPWAERKQASQLVEHGYDWTTAYYTLESYEPYEPLLSDFLTYEDLLTFKNYIDDHYAKQWGIYFTKYLGQEVIVIKEGTRVLKEWWIYNGALVKFNQYEDLKIFTFVAVGPIHWNNIIFTIESNYHVTIDPQFFQETADDNDRGIFIKVTSTSPYIYEWEYKN